MQLAKFTDLELLDIKRALGIALASETAGKNQQKRWQELFDRFADITASSIGPQP